MVWGTDHFHVGFALLKKMMKTNQNELDAGKELFMKEESAAFIHSHYGNKNETTDKNWKTNYW